jgi:hypothetical protein
MTGEKDNTLMVDRAYALTALSIQGGDQIRETDHINGRVEGP